MRTGVARAAGAVGAERSRAGISGVASLQGAERPQVRALAASEALANRSAQAQATAQLQRLLDGGRGVAALQDTSDQLAAAGAGVVQGFFEPTKISDEKSMKENIAGALAAGEEAAGGDGNLIATEANVDKCYKLFSEPTDKSIGVYADSKNFVSFAERALRRLEIGAYDLMSDILHWQQMAVEEGNGVQSFEAVHVNLTGSELHDRGLGVALVDFRYVRSLYPHQRMQVINNPFNSVEEGFKTLVLKPDDRSFEQALLGKGNGSVAEQLNEEADLGSDGIETLGMRTDKQHGSVVEFVEENLGSYLSSWQRYLTRDRQSTVEAVAFAFLTGLWDLHSENIKHKGGKPVLIDAEVGLQPDIYKRQHKKGNIAIRNSGFQQMNTNHQVIDDQLDGRGNGSNLLDWAKKNPETLVKILAKTIGDTRARIVPVFTGQWFYLRNRFLKYHFLGNEKYQAEVLGTAANDIEHGERLFRSPGLEAEVGEDRGGLFDPKSVGFSVGEDFMAATIPEFNYQPSTGLVFHHGKPIWQGEDFKDSMKYLVERLKGED